MSKQSDGQPARVQTNVFDHKCRPRLENKTDVVDLRVLNASLVTKAGIVF